MKDNAQYDLKSLLVCRSQAIKQKWFNTVLLPCKLHLHNIKNFFQEKVGNIPFLNIVFEHPCLQWCHI